MKATDLLESQHEEVADLFERIEKADDDDKSELFEKLAARLVGHDAIEREIFYPAVERKLGMTEDLGEALVEHGVVEFSLYQADQALGENDFDHKLTVLKEMVEHHVEEEEREFFPKVEKALGATRLEELGAQMQARFEAALKSDFRVPLSANLRQVLAGALKTKPANGRTKAVSKTVLKKSVVRSSTPARRAGKRRTLSRKSA